MRAFKIVLKMMIAILFLCFMVMSAEKATAEELAEASAMNHGFNSKGSSWIRATAEESAEGNAITTLEAASGVEQGGGIATIDTVTFPDTYVFTGAAQDAIPIIVPPGRGDIVPKLSLRYNSYRKNGWVGLGWDLDLGVIQRATKHGVNYTADDYVLVKDGSHTELVSRSDDWGAGYYGAKIEGGFAKFYLNPSTGAL